MKQKGKSVVLGLDLGTSSVGWTLIEMKNKEPVRLLRTGVRVFEAAIDPDQFSRGTGDPKNAERRNARQQRRMTDRRARRIRKIFHLLQKAGLLPEGEAADVIPALDKTILARYTNGEDADTPSRDGLAHVLQYWLRARALDHKLEPDELGRAFYHLAQRRGFLSNRKAAKRDDEDDGAVKKGISELRADMEEARARTLGEYFAMLEPRDERIRARWTARKMYLDEFEKIWATQAHHHPAILTQEFRQLLHKAIFFQRPLKSSKSLIGACSLEPNRKRAPWALLCAQRFRLLQQINHARILTPDGDEIALTPEQRTLLVDQLETKKEWKLTQARKALKLGKGYIFTIELGGEKVFKGNSTNMRLAKIFGERWTQFSDEEKNLIVDDLRSIESEETLEKRGMEKWGLPPEEATAFARLNLEDKYCNHSRQAITKLLPLLEKGVEYSTAAKEAYGHLRRPVEIHEQLPPLCEVADIRNPVVNRTLTELRKVVNAIVREHGKPDLIRVELARDMRKTAKQRQEATRRNRLNEKSRQDAAAKAINETGEENPSRRDIEKVLLAEECNWRCPYTDKPINIAQLLGANPQFDIEHIIPFSRSLDNSFLNKTLCDTHENKNVKSNKTPYETYGHDETRWDEILQRVKHFKSGAAKEKLRRFALKEPAEIEGFTKQQLNDTRYATKEAMNYLSLLYGGLSDEEKTQRIQGCRGGTTYFLRNVWELNGILGDGGMKSRDDHRHHAVDAIVVALTNPKTIQMLSNAAACETWDNRRLFRDQKPPWEGFLDDIRAAIGAIKVSHRVARKVKGALHQETIYSPPTTDADGKPCVYLRRRLDQIKTGEIKNIVDERVRDLVQAKLTEPGGNLKMFQDPKNHPCFKSGMPIHKVRIRSSVNTIPIGKGSRERHVKTGSNHHMAIFETTTNEKTKWEGIIVTRYEAMQRLAARKPVVQRDAGEDKKFIMTLSSGELMEIDDKDGGREVVVVRTVSVTGGGRADFVSLNDARKKTDIAQAKDWRTATPKALLNLNCRKVTLTPLGEKRRAND